MSVQATTIIPKYGEPNEEYQSRYCYVWNVKKDFPWFPAESFFVNKEFKDKLFIAFTKLQASKLNKEIKTFDGCFVQRPVRGMSVPSLHSWAMAIDINASTEKLSQSVTNFSKGFLDCFISSGIYWGGTWHRHDSMHFALYNG